VEELAGAGLVGQLQAVGLVESRVRQNEKDPLCSLMCPSLLIWLLAVPVQEISCRPKEAKVELDVREEGRERVQGWESEASRGN
jgi:hypothetical protein